MKTTVEIGKELTERLKFIFGENIYETKGSGNQKGDLDLHSDIYVKDTSVIKLWFEAKNKASNINAIIDRNEFKKAVEQAETFGAIPVYATNDKDQEIYCAVKAEDLNKIISIIKDMADYISDL